MADQFFSFEKVLRELHLEEEELKRLVSEGEIRAFRDEDKMKFKKEDIDRFKTKKNSDSPTIESGSGELTEELFGEEEAGAGDVGMVTQQIPDKSFLEEEEVQELEPAKPARAEKPAARRPAPAARPARRRVEQTTQVGEGMLVQVMLILSAIVLLYASLVVFNAAEVRPTGLSSGLASWVGDTFLKK